VKRWQDGVNIALGFWLAASPWIFGPAKGAGLDAAWNACLLGAAMMLFAGIALYVPKAWEEWVVMVLGLWVFFSPWVIGFSGQRAATLNAVVVGLLAILFAASAMSLDKALEKRWHHDRGQMTY
jgi:SPW repeat-containing protein